MRETLIVVLLALQILNELLKFVETLGHKP